MEKRIFLNVLTSNDKIHSYHQELLANPPIEYVNQKQGFYGFKNIDKNKKTYYLIKKILNTTKIPNIIYIKERYDLIHSYNSLIINRTPWILDFEMVAGLVGFNSNRLNSIIAKKIIKKYTESKYCRKILPWSHAAEKSLLNYTKSEKLKDKIQVIYPTTKPLEKQKKEKSNKIKLLFLGGYFLAKGGKEVLNIFQRLEKKYDIELTIISNIPEKLNKEYKNIKIIPSIPKEEVSKYFNQADIFIMPTHYDTYGFVFLEAMSLGIPVIATKLFATPEIIEHEKTGFLTIAPKVSWFDNNFQLNYIGKHEDIWKKFNNDLLSIKDQELEDSLYNYTKELIENTSLRNKMGKESIKRFQENFSLEERNKKLKEVYESSINEDETTN